MQKRIVIDGAIFGLQRAGGISRLWAEMLLDMDKNLPHEVILLMPKNRNVEWKAVAPRLKKIIVIPRKTFRWGRRSYFRDMLYLTAVAWRLEPDLWHSSFYVGMPLGSFAKVVTCHDMIPEVLGTASSYETKMKRKALKASDLVISVSKNSQKDMGELWPGLLAKSHVVPAFLSECPLQAKETSSPYFVHVGKRSGYKNFLPACLSLLRDPRFKQYQIYVIGGEEQWSTEEEEAFGAEPRVVRLGILQHSEVERYIASSEALLFPSLYEGFGIPILEALRQGVPVLAQRISSIPEVTGEEYPLADPLDPCTLGDTLERLLQEKAHWSSYGIQRAELFSKTSVLPKLYKLYEETMRAF